VLLSCADRHLAGLGSPQVYGVETAADGVAAASNQGHNKRVAILPQAYSWAATAVGASNRLPTCVTYWSNWMAQSPYSLKLG
jgi:subtilisin family serine protease